MKQYSLSGNQCGLMSLMSEEDASELLFRIVEMWVTVRGFSITSKWMEEYKQAKEKVVKKR